MAAYVAGDGTAFDRLFTALGPRVYGFFMRTFNNTAVADDLTQITFLKVHKARADFQRDKPLRPWLFSIAARVRVDELRKLHPGKHVALEDDTEAGDSVAPEPAPPADEILDEAARARRVRTALDALPEAQRVIIHLHRFEGLSFPQIAEALGTTEGAIKLRAFRAYEKLRQDLRGLL
ncbi:MAG: RNA polymerase sigma factor [Deltaproteobacteria bacterium]|nr:RNA polymerase sigma factor [Deltaproteobacteria bacterium]